MNLQPSPQEVQGAVLSIDTCTRTTGRSLFRRLVPAISSATLAIALSACSSTTPGMVDHVDRSAGVTFLPIPAYSAGEALTSSDFPFSESSEDIGSATEAKPDYLTSLLRDLPWE
ncbi:hypothetical protein [Haloferula sp.]|uniref:hypothetical protein n=1 Tax=Haloferula sp. TaxID=2497595 RepID=UPI0032A07637